MKKWVAKKPGVYQKYCGSKVSVLFLASLNKKACLVKSNNKIRFITHGTTFFTWLSFTNFAYINEQQLA